MAVFVGLIAIIAPLVRVVSSSHRPVERSVGAGRPARRWPAAVAITVSLTAFAILLWRPIPLPLTDLLERAFDTLGFLVYLMGIGLYLWGLVALGSQFGVSSFAGADLLAGHKLVVNGPFRLMRHPMYLGVLLAAPWALLLFRTWAMLLFVPLAPVVLLRAEQEERLLEEAYGERWLRYAERVPKWLPRWR